MLPFVFSQISSSPWLFNVSHRFSKLPLHVSIQFTRPKRETRHKAQVAFQGGNFHSLKLHFLNAHPDIPWAKIRASRNAFIHGYDKIDDRIVWNIVTKLLPPLRLSLSGLLNSL